MKFFCLVCLDILCDYILNMYIVNFNDFSLETFGSIKCIIIDRISQSVDINCIFFPLEKINGIEINRSIYLLAL